MMSTCNERMVQLLAHLKMNANELATSLGYKRTDRIYNVINGRNGISPALARDICSLYPINYDWLMTGEGEMLRQDAPPVAIKEGNIVKFNIKGNERFNERRKMVERIKLIAPQFVEEPNGAISVVLKHLVEHEPTKALWVMTGKDDKVVLSRKDYDALIGRMEAFKTLYETERELNTKSEKKAAGIKPL